MNTLFKSLAGMLLLALLVNSASAVVTSNECVRLKYYGSPINLIHKDHEYIHSILQYSNVNTTVKMVAYNKTNDSIANITYEDVIYEISYTPTGSTTIERRALIMRIATPQGQHPRLNNYILTDPTHISFPFYLVAMFNLQLVADKIWGEPEYYLNCQMLKEEYTYFPALFPSRFSKILQ